MLVVSDKQRDELLASMIWPTKPTKGNMCLLCGIAKRQRHSWFCRVECEDVYIERKNNASTHTNRKKEK